MGAKAQTVKSSLQTEGKGDKGTIIIRAMSPKEEQKPIEQPAQPI
jgi:hypothetical protein